MYTLKLAQLYMTLESTRAHHEEPKSVLFVTSPEAYITLPLCVTYGAAKAGTRMLFRTSRAPFSTLGIRVNSIAPWLMQTPMSKEIAPVLKDLEVRFTSLDEHVKVAMHLLCDNTVVGRAIAVGQPSVRDVCDDADGGDGSQYFQMLKQDWPSYAEQLTKMYQTMGLEGLGGKYAGY